MAFEVEICASYSLAMLHEQINTCIAERAGWKVISAYTTCMERSYGQHKRQLHYTCTVLFRKIKQKK